MAPLTRSVGGRIKWLLLLEMGAWANELQIFLSLPTKELKTNNDAGNNKKGANRDSERSEGGSGRACDFSLTSLFFPSISKSNLFWTVWSIRRKKWLAPAPGRSSGRAFPLSGREKPLLLLLSPPKPPELGRPLLPPPDLLLLLALPVLLLPHSTVRISPSPRRTSPWPSDFALSGTLPSLPSSSSSCSSSDLLLLLCDVCLLIGM